jgi:hypothetical protein
MPQRRDLYWDSYQTWTKPIPEKIDYVELFRGHPSGCATSVCNFPYPGRMPPFDNTVLAVGAQIRTSEPHITEILLANTTVEFFVNHEPQLTAPLMYINRDFLTGEEREARQIDEVPDGFMENLVEPIKVPAHVLVFGRLDFAAPAINLIRRLETRIGPGAGWAEIVLYLLCRPDFG